MRKNTFILMTVAMVLAIAFSSCRRDDDTPPPVDVTGVVLNWATASLEPGDTFTLTAIVTPEDATNPELTWTTGNSDVATVTAQGVVTGVVPGTTTITASSVDGEFTATSTITVVAKPVVADNFSDAMPGWGPTLGTISFASDQTWTIGGLTWSDAVVAEVCVNRTTFNGGLAAEGFRADCRNNRGIIVTNLAVWPWDPPLYDTTHFDFAGSLFSFAAVYTFRKQLCPDGWRVPRQEDFEALYRALGSSNPVDQASINRFLNDWGGDLVGNVSGAGVHPEQQLEQGSYWSVTEASATNGRRLLFGTQFGDLTVNASSPLGKGSGMTVRCVR